MGGHSLSDKRLVSPFYSYGFRKLSLGHTTEQQFADGSRACYQLSAISQHTAEQCGRVLTSLLAQRDSNASTSVFIQ